MQVRAVEEVQEGLMPQAQRFFLLTQIDNLWKEHLQAMQFLRQAVGLRGYAIPLNTALVLSDADFVLQLLHHSGRTPRAVGTCPIFVFPEF